VCPTTTALQLKTVSSIRSATLRATTMRRLSRLFVFASLLATGCNRESSEAEHQVGSGSEPGLAPRVQPAAPELSDESHDAGLESSIEPAPVPVPTPAPDPMLDERKQALTNVGRSAFEALQADDFEALLQLTPLVEGYLREVCPDRPVSPREQLQARFEHCRKSVPWADVAEAQAFAGTPTGAPADGCKGGIEDYGRLQLFLHMSDAKIWRIQFFGAIGEGGNPIGISGEINCQQVDEAPKLK
jgi:hypothetical protein